MSGITSYHAGLSAEGAVERHYARRGLPLAARRWRGKAGEIDLILRAGRALVFVEVKKARDHARAAASLRPRQMARLMAAAEEYLSGEREGLATPCRFDVALVDGAGRIEIVENALGP